MNQHRVKLLPAVWLYLPAINAQSFSISHGFSLSLTLLHWNSICSDSCVRKSKRGIWDLIFQELTIDLIKQFTAMRACHGTVMIEKENKGDSSGLKSRQWVGIAKLSFFYATDMQIPATIWHKTLTYWGGTPLSRTLCKIYYSAICSHRGTSNQRKCEISKVQITLSASF